MRTAETPTDRLARYVIQRRAQLGLSQIAVWHAGGPSNSTLTGIENGAAAMVSPSTMRKLDTALQWTEGSVRAILAGGEPTDLDTMPIPDVTTPEGLRWIADCVEACGVRSETHQLHGIRPDAISFSARSLRDRADQLDDEATAAAVFEANLTELAQVIFNAGYDEGDPERNAARAALDWMRSRGVR